MIKMKDKKRILIGSMLYMVLLAILVINAPAFQAKDYDRVYKGLTYRVDGTEVQSDTVHLQGKFYKPILGNSHFDGTLSYGDKTYATSFKVKKNAYITIFDEADYTGANATLGYLCTARDLDSISILILEYDDSYHKGWSSENGLVFTGDAETVDEAFEQMSVNVGETVFGGMVE